MKLNIDGLERLGATRKELLEVAEEVLKMDQIEKRSKAQLQEIGANPNLRIDDPKTVARIEEPSRWLSIIAPRRKALEAKEKTLRQELKTEFVAQHGAFVNVLRALREARLKEYRDSLTTHYHEGSRLQERICKEHGPLCDRVREVSDAINSLTPSSGPGTEGRIIEDAQRFCRNARSIGEKFGKEIEALGDQRAQEKPKKVHRIRIEKLTLDRSDDSEQKRMVNTAPPAFIDGDYFESGKVYDVTATQYATLRALGIAVDVGAMERAVEAVKELVK